MHVASETERATPGQTGLDGEESCVCLKRPEKESFLRYRVWSKMEGRTQERSRIKDRRRRISCLCCHPFLNVRCRYRNDFCHLLHPKHLLIVVNIGGIRSQNSALQLSVAAAAAPRQPYTGIVCCLTACILCPKPFLRFTLSPLLPPSLPRSLSPSLSSCPYPVSSQRICQSEV